MTDPFPVSYQKVLAWCLMQWPEKVVPETLRWMLLKEHVQVLSGERFGREAAPVGCCPGLSGFRASRSFTNVTKTFFGAASGEKSSLCLAEPPPQRQRYGPHAHGVYLLVGL